MHHYLQIKGLPEALDTPFVWSNYHKDYAPKGPQIIKAFNKGNAVFTFPKPPLKCPGAPQKIVYITERLLKEVKYTITNVLKNLIILTYQHMTLS